MMTNTQLSSELFRVIDANLNRLREGIRVIEDIMRYKENNKHFASQLKELRHQARTPDTKLLLMHRDSINDVLKGSTKSEQHRISIESIIIANFKRAEESSRVLEELYKLSDIQLSENFKSIRYALYNLEKEVLLNESE
jgi:thiamine-phosphate pyrophosphorylase